MLRCADRQIVFEESRCTRCGACLAVCPVDALSLVHEDPAFEIAVNRQTCIVCRKCVKVCPAQELPNRPLTEADFDGLRHLTLAHAKDEGVRYRASSGGVARTLARVALEKGLVDAVYGVRQNDTPPYYEGAYFTKPEELARMANSVYYVFPFARGLRREAGAPPIRRLLFIGLNCQIQAAENYFRNTGVELIKLAVLCKQQKTLDHVRWVRRGLGQPLDYPAPLHFRGDGWPGQVRSGGKVLTSFFGLSFLLECWRPSGCRLCANPFGWGSDLVLTDPWHLPMKDERTGITLTLLRTPAGEALWAQAKEALCESACLPPSGKGDCARPLVPEDARISIEWQTIRKTRVAARDFYLGREPSRKKRIVFTLLESLRRCSGYLLLHAPFAKVTEWWVIRISARLRRGLFRFLEP